ncbi:MAG: hypothetical protein AN483_06955 [Aphanizomenon flos-aquae MDT14a]|jgi:hypothetical protein|uniref:Uncharacterized protein n=1 Tax=Aphanizomenon flos-aquae WA102 TaxID=1710896 RepID=A0A1B7WZA4_APHFL|nr:MAG: hypothetical protein AN483_06955 [Aphanizomenon flos-aquae MDT14a]OBQ42423.1 MAG: hypothetical protein AN484_17905 [Aphanizomenon flos-aquae WA102]
MVGLRLGGNGCGGILPKTRNPCCAGIAICFYRQDWADFRFLAGGTGVVRALVQMVGLRLGGTAAGEYCQKHETLAVRGLQYVFTDKTGQILGF